MLVLYYLETWEGKDGRDGGRRIAEAFLSTLGEASVVVVVVFVEFYCVVVILVIVVVIIITIRTCEQCSSLVWGLDFA